MTKSTVQKTALVTGASSGIGEAITRRLAERSIRVLALGRDQASLERLASEVTGVTPCTVDLSNAESIGHLFEEQTVDILVNNAGLITSSRKFHEQDPAEIDEMVDVNFRAPLRLASMALPGMIARGQGHLFFLGSSAGRFPHANAAAYGATKAAVSLFCDALRCDLLGTGVRVTEVAPGRVQTNLYRTALGPELAQEKLYDGFRAARPDDIARIVMSTLELPDYVDVSRIEVFPTDQAPGGSLNFMRS